VLGNRPAFFTNLRFFHIAFRFIRHTIATLAKGRLFLQKKEMYHLILAGYFALIATAHPIHLGLSDVLYAEKEKSLQVIHKLFVDDLEAHIEQIAKESGSPVRLFLNTEKENPQSDQYIQQYLDTHFQVLANGKLLKSHYLGKEYENGAVWVYVEYPNLSRPKQLRIRGDALIGLHEDQNNIVNIEIGEKKGSFRFFKGHIQEQINL
jgi:hypothetical protein